MWKVQALSTFCKSFWKSTPLPGSHFIFDRIWLRCNNVQMHFKYGRTRLTAVADVCCVWPEKHCAECEPIKESMNLNRTRAKASDLKCSIKHESSWSAVPPSTLFFSTFSFHSTSPCLLLHLLLPVLTLTCYRFFFFFLFPTMFLPASHFPYIW